MSRKWRNILIGALIAVLVIGGIWLLSRSPENFKAKYEGVDLSTDITGIGRGNTYAAYKAQYEDLPAGPRCIPRKCRTSWEASA